MIHNSPRIFVSRYLREDAPLHKYLTAIDAQVTALSLIDFKPCPFELPDSEWLFFYSKSGVDYFIDKIESLETLSKYKFATFGEMTGQALEKAINKPVDYVGNAQADKVIAELFPQVGSKGICFVCGKASIRSVQKKWPATLAYKEVIVYDHQPKKDIELSQYDIAILTSPMNVEAFLQSGGQAKTILCIGTTTAAAIRTHPGNILIADSPSEKGIVLSLQSYLN